MFAAYDRLAASAYAMRHGVSYNNAQYYNWENYIPGTTYDCANFVSQCLYAGGKSFKGTPGVSDVGNFSNWFGQGNTMSLQKYSETWRGTDAFKHHWKANSSYQEFTSIGTASYDYGYTGYPISLLNVNGRAYHTVIIVGYAANKDLVLAQHSSGSVNALLSQKGFSSFIIYNPA